MNADWGESGPHEHIERRGKKKRAMIAAEITAGSGESRVQSEAVKLFTNTETYTHIPTLRYSRSLLFLASCFLLNEANVRKYCVDFRYLFCGRSA